MLEEVLKFMKNQINPSTNKTSALFKQWQAIFNDAKRHPLSDFIHKHYGITMCAYDLEGRRQTSSSSSKFCHAMLHNPKTEAICHDFIKESLCNPKDTITTTICPLGIVVVIAPIHYQNKIIGTTVCNNMVLKDSFIPETVREKYHLKDVDRENLQKLEEFLQILMNLVNISEELDTKSNMLISKDNFKELGLSRREQEVACLILKGMPNKKIGELLYVTEATVKSHVSSVLSKLGLNSRYELIDRFGKR